MSLTGDEREAGRYFRRVSRQALDALNELDPPGLRVPDPSHRVARHDCPARGGASTGIALREKRWESPELWVCCCSVIGPKGEFRVFPHDDCQGGRVLAAGGRFAWLFKEGKCSGCRLAARSARGRLLIVPPADSPGRGGQTPAHPGNTRQPGP